jgi:hypothetical protein
MQMATLSVTLGLALSWGLIVGAILRLPIFDQPARKDQFDDGVRFFPTLALFHFYKLYPLFLLCLALVCGGKPAIC